MKIELNKIKPSPKPIRSSWDEESMQNLRWSLMEEGQVEPIGVHENHNGYVIVWGHRRVEAARRAAWTEIEAVIVPQDEVNNLIQAGIENLGREDMSADDKAEWAQRLVDMGLGQREISRRSTVPIASINNWINIKRQKASGLVFNVEQSTNSRDEGVYKIVNVATVLGNDLQAKQAVLDKSTYDKLTQFQTRELAEAYRDAPTPEVKAAVLKAPIISRDTAADILRRSINRVEMEGGQVSQKETNEWTKEQDEKRTYQAFDFAVKEFLDSVRLFMEVAKKGATLIKYGKYSPEAARFAIRKIDNLIDELKNYKDALEGIL